MDELPVTNESVLSNAIVMIHSSIKVSVDLNDPGKPEAGAVNDGYNKDLDRSRPSLMDQYLELASILVRFLTFILIFHSS